MGADQSRQSIVNLDDALKEAESLPFETDGNNSQSSGRGTVNVENALPIIEKLLKPIVAKRKHPLRVMEVGSGNGFNTKKIAELSDVIESIDGSDLQKHEPSYYDITTSPGHEFVELKWSEENDMLLLVSPTNDNVRLDYGSIKALERKHTRPTYLMILGELGASDGTEGIYHYLTEGSDWKKVAEIPFIQYKDILGEDCIKAVNLFLLP